MEIDVTEVDAQRSTEFRYQITVRKSDGKNAEYYLDFNKITQKMRLWFTHIYTHSKILDYIYLIEFYDVKALTARDINQRSQFDTFGKMRYSLSERERFFVTGLGEAIYVSKNKVKPKLFSASPSGRLSQEFMIGC
ncbi:Uncharacterised protein [Serratia proteamaculans]|uniref:hypothetical protein n=1 Tax=Serratia proteamaculans TaxID=28151 RepID=UPI0021784FE7|nr:hypothetical protein [Serratia proteamaculans]CAI0769822.1 Uncharacterised protein [Serratia proteamaculans]CAI1558904.1 Uncharacterised protein [Serratia proteamaculans]